MTITRDTIIEMCKRAQPQTDGQREWLAQVQRALAINVGDGLAPDPVWQETTRDRLPNPCIVLDIRYQQSQTGVMLLVEAVNGKRMWLDAGWFV